MTKVLLSGFEPQWGIKKTPSGELAKVWANGDVSIPGFSVRGIVLPQIFGKSSEILKNEAIRFKPDFILMYGASQHDSPIRYERFAINVIDTAMGDNNRIPIRDSSIIRGGPAAYETSIEILGMIEFLKSKGVNAIPSYHAGTHTCNELYYQITHWLSSNPFEHKVHACFIHCAFSNEFGVIEDRGFSTPSFSDIIKSSMETIQYLGNLTR